MTAELATTIIGLAGKKRSGKSTIASVLAANHGFTEIILAGPLKAALSRMFAAGGIDNFLELPKEDIIPRIGASPRHLMQTLGTEWGRQLIHPHIWLRMAENRMAHERLLYRHDKFVISDIRFEDEAAWVRSMGGIVMHVHNAKAQQADDAHASEAGVEFQDGDAFFNNSKVDMGSLEVRLAALIEVWPSVSQSLLHQRKAIQQPAAQ